MKQFSRFLCLLLTLALLLPGVLANAEIFEEDEEKVGDLYELYNVTNMIVLNDKLYTLTYGPTLCEYDGENWFVTVPTAAFSSVCRVYSGEDDSDYFYSDEGDALLVAGEDGDTVEVFLPYSNGILDHLSVSLSSTEVTLLESFQLPLPVAEETEETDDDAYWTSDLYIDCMGSAYTGDAAYFLVYGLTDTEVYNLYTLVELNLTDGSIRRVTDDYFGAILPLDDQSLIAYYNCYTDLDNPVSSLVKVDRQTGLTQTLCELPTDESYTGFSSSDGAIVFNNGSQVFRVAAPYDTMETVAYLPPAGIYSTLPGCVSGSTYYSYSYDGGLSAIDLTAPLPTTVLRVDNNLLWSSVADLIRQYAKEHPEVGIVYGSVTASTAPEYTQHMQSDEALDIYSFYLPGDAFPALRDKGYLADLSSSADLKQAVAEMFPGINVQLLLDDHVYGLPYAISTSCWAIDTSVLEAVGLSAEDVPTTYLELLNLIDDWITIYIEDYPDYQLLDYPYSLTNQLFSLILMEQISECEVEGRTLTFNDPDFIATLNKLEDMRERLTDYETRWEEEHTTEGLYGNYVIGGSWSSDSTTGGTLLRDYYSLDIDTNTSYYDDSTVIPLFPSISAGQTGYAVGNLAFMSVNRASRNVDAAQALLTYIANNRSPYMKATYSPAYTDNIEDEDYEETKEYYEVLLASLNEEMAKADDSEKRDYEDSIKYIEEALSDMSPWLYVTEDILVYDGLMEHFHLMETTVFYGDSSEAATLLTRFIDGNIGVDQFVRELTRIVQMMILENS